MLDVTNGLLLNLSLLRRLEVKLYNNIITVSAGAVQPLVPIAPMQMQCQPGIDVP